MYQDHILDRAPNTMRVTKHESYLQLLSVKSTQHRQRGSCSDDLVYGVHIIGYRLLINSRI